MLFVRDCLDYIEIENNGSVYVESKKGFKTYIEGEHLIPENSRRIEVRLTNIVENQEGRPL